MENLGTLSGPQGDFLFSSFSSAFCSNICGVHWRWAKRPTSRFATLEGSMEQRAAGNSPGNTSGDDSSQTPHHEGRGVWVLTAYGISGLALFGILIYYFSIYVTR
jgi:hypothetical protein